MAVTTMDQGQPQGQTKLKGGFCTIDQGLTKGGQTRTYQVTRTWNRKGCRCISLNLEKKLLNPKRK